MIAALLVACVAPSPVEAGSPLLNPGESELALVYEGPGWLVGESCDGPGLRLEVGPGLLWPYELAADELVEVWVVAEPNAQQGVWWCEVHLLGRSDGVSVSVVEL